MKVLAKRSDKIFLWGPIVMALCAFIIYNSSYIGMLFSTFRTRRIIYVCLLICIVTCFDLLHRLLVPKVIIEYDDYGLYIYKYKRQPPATIRYSDLKGALALEGANDSYELNGINNISGFSTGMLRIQTSKGLITLYGVENVREVGTQLRRMIGEYNHKVMEEYEQRIEQMKRQRELEELQKHDPNT